MTDKPWDIRREGRAWGEEALARSSLTPEKFEMVRGNGEATSMGLTVLEIEVGNPASPETTERIEFLIDSGAIYSVVPSDILNRLGIRPVAEQTFRLADGTKIKRKKGIALFRYGERVGGADVIFGEEGDSNLLGAFTLEALGLSLDPLRRQLHPLPMILALEQDS